MSLIKEHISNLKQEVNQMTADGHIKDPAVGFGVMQLEQSIDYLEVAFKHVINIDACEK